VNPDDTQGGSNQYGASLSGAVGFCKNYKRDHEIASTLGKPSIMGSSDPSFRGDAARWNPEELLVAALSTCRKLWYPHLCTEAGVRVLEYADKAEGVTEGTLDGSGRFIANSFNFTVGYDALIVTE